LSFFDPVTWAAKGLGTSQEPRTRLMKKCRHASDLRILVGILILTAVAHTGETKNQPKFTTRHLPGAGASLTQPRETDGKPSPVSTFHHSPDTLQSLYSFCSVSNCTDGANPRVGLIQDATGTLYGTTSVGGANNSSNCAYVDVGCGTLFKLDTAGNETVLYSFCSVSNCTDGANPAAGLIEDAAANLYGTTERGGANGGGTLFQLDTTGTETILYNFCSVSNCADGATPAAGLIQDSTGNFYGTTEFGGANTGSGKGGGAVFELDTAGTETILYSFCSVANCADGANPAAGLIQDSAGNLYGTTEFGGANNSANCYHLSCGTIFEVDTAGTETVLYSFCSVANCTDGVWPVAGLIQDVQGNLYGTTWLGGAGISNNCFNGGCGTIFKLDSAGNETTLYSFCSAANCTDGLWPVAGLAQDSTGNLYGTTQYGGANDGGSVFEFDTTGAETVLYSFCSVPGCKDGVWPVAGLIQDASGNLYGTTIAGGADNGGMVFELQPQAAVRASKSRATR
jgi:uncharacterized repeat protein (TIGR03803 family)